MSDHDTHRREVPENGCDPTGWRTMGFYDSTDLRRFPMVALILVLAALFSVAPVRAEHVPQCRFPAGALPAQTLRRGKPHGMQIPIDTVVVLMQENRSFDHYLGQLHIQGQPRSRPVPPGASNPDPTNPANQPITRFPQMKYCEVADLDHSWNGTHNEWDGGRMDGFTAANQDATNDPTGKRTMGFYDSGDLPFYYALYGTFAMADHYFCSALTQTFPNRFYLLAATSFGHIANDFPTGFNGIPAIGGGTTGTEFTQPTIFNLLDNPCFPNPAGSCSTPPVTWKIYHNEIAFAYEFGYVRMHGQ